MIQLSDELKARTVLNLGCGYFPMPGALNVDIRPESKSDILLDLDDAQALLELPHGHYEKIILDHSLEHVGDAFETLRSCAELLKPGGLLEVRTPHFSRGFTHSDHKHGFDIGLPHYLDPSLKAFYYGPTLQLVSMRLDWAVRFDIYRMVAPAWQVNVLRALNAIITPIANLSPAFCSRIWCFWVGGFEQIEYVFSKP